MYSVIITSFNDIPNIIFQGQSVTYKVTISNGGHLFLCHWPRHKLRGIRALIQLWLGVNSHRLLRENICMAKHLLLYWGWIRNDHRRLLCKGNIHVGYYMLIYRGRILIYILHLHLFKLLLQDCHLALERSYFGRIRIILNGLHRGLGDWRLIYWLWLGHDNLRMLLDKARLRLDSGL
jgi:hypothetical protein